MNKTKVLCQRSSKNKRTAVTTREIVKYIASRIDRLREAEFVEEDERKRLILLKRKAELDKLLGVINNDTIQHEIKKMKHNKYSKYKHQETDDEKCDRWAKAIDPAGTFLDECKDAVDWMYGIKMSKEADDCPINCGCDCHMFIGGSGKPCPSCSQNLNKELSK